MKGTYRNPRQRHADTVRSEARAQALNNRLAMVASSTSATLAASQARMAQLRAGGALTWQVPSPAPAPSAIAGAVFAAPVPPPNYTAPAPYVPPPAPLESKPMLEMPKWMMTAGQSAASDAAKASSAADAAAAAETAAASAAFMQAYKAAPTVKEEEPSLEPIFGGPSSSAAPAPQASLQPTKSSSYEEEDPDDNGPMVMVDGVEKGFYSVTEEDQEQMSIEEHDAYAKLYAELA